jgi:AcrR family transcriptional regulator
MKHPALSPRRMPRQDRARVTRDAILEAATHIIAQGGLAAFNTNAVAMRAGVSIGSLYQYFPNKDALMVAVIHRQQEQQHETLKSAVNASSDGDLETVVRALIRAAMQHHYDDSLLATAIDHEEARLPMNDVLDAYLDRGGALVATLIGEFADEIRMLDPDHAARTLPALVRAVIDAWANMSPPRLDLAEEEAVRAVLGYLRKGNPDVRT